MRILPVNDAVFCRKWGEKRLFPVRNVTADRLFRHLLYGKGWPFAMQRVTFRSL